MRDRRDVADATTGRVLYRSNMAHSWWALLVTLWLRDSTGDDAEAVLQARL